MEKYEKIIPKLSLLHWGRSGGAMVLGKLPVLGRPTNLDKSRARAYCACSRCGLFGHFFSHLSFLFSFSLSLGDGPISTEILSPRAVNPKQPTHQIPVTASYLQHCKEDIFFINHDITGYTIFTLKNV